jgi:HEAT repeat protein
MPTKMSACVLAELGGRSPALLLEAVRASGEIQIEQAVPALAELLGESDLELQKEIARALGQIGTRAAVRILEPLAASDNAELREAAEEALEEASFDEVGLDPLLASFGLPDDEGDELGDDENAFDDDDLDDDDEEEEQGDSDDSEWADDHLELR